MRGPKCDFEVSRKDYFCPYCGHELKNKKEEIDEEEIQVEYTKVNEDDKKVNEEEGYIEKDRVIALFSYISFLFIIPLITCPNSKFAKFHANQGIILCIASAILGIINIPLELVEFFNFPIAINLVITGIIDAILTCFSIYGIYNALTGKMKPLPIIGKFKILK